MDFKNMHFENKLWGRKLVEKFPFYSHYSHIYIYIYGFNEYDLNIFTKFLKIKNCNTKIILNKIGKEGAARGGEARGVSSSWIFSVGEVIHLGWMVPDQGMTRVFTSCTTPCTKPTPGPSKLEHECSIISSLPLLYYILI